MRHLREVPPILSGVPGSFARQVFHDRHPRLVAQLGDAYPYSSKQRRALADLLDETLTGLMRPLPASADDRVAWDRWNDGYFGRAWGDAPFLWAESYFYRRLLEAVSYFEPGPWYGIDPFEFLKSAELSDPALPTELHWIDELAGLSGGDRTEALLLAALWGNRADLGFRIGLAAAREGAAQAAQLVADDSIQVLGVLGSRSVPGRVAVVADNAGRELLADLVLIDHLIGAELAEQVTIHLKPRPYFVSDATTADLVACLRRMQAVEGAAAGVAGRLRRAVSDDRVRLYTHEFYCSPLTFHQLPADLAGELGSMSLTVLKGDLNYRRLVGDLHWPATTPFIDTVDYFPSPVVALRTLKSDVIVGLDQATVSHLERADPAWRTNGAHGLVQARL